MRRLLNARVLDLADESAAHCTKLLAGMGADVICIEPPGGSPARQVGPFYQNEPHPERSLHWFHHNLNKRSITLDIRSADGQALFKRLVETAAIVVECFPPGYLDEIGLGYAQLSAINPAIILTSITPFGQTGPYSQYKGCDMIAAAMGGLMNVTGDMTTPPLHASIPLSYVSTGAQASYGTLLAYYHAQRAGQGQQVDVSQQECTTRVRFPYHTAWKAMGVMDHRNGDSVAVPGTPERRVYFRCTDGWVAAAPTYWSHVHHTVEWLKENGLGEMLAEAGVDKYDIKPGGTMLPDEILDAITDAFAVMAERYSKNHMFREGQARGMQVAPINSMDAVLSDEHLRARGHLIEVDHPELGRSLTYTRPPFRMDGVDIDYNRRAPLIGEHNRDVYQGELGLTDDDLRRYEQAGVI